MTKSSDIMLLMNCDNVYQTYVIIKYGIGCIWKLWQEVGAVTHLCVVVIERTDLENECCNLAENRI